MDAARGADLFICESYFFAKKISYHLDYATLREKRAQLKCSRVILTHMSEDMQGHSGEAEIERAEDGMTIII